MKVDLYSLILTMKMMMVLEFTKLSLSYIAQLMLKLQKRWYIQPHLQVSILNWEVVSQLKCNVMDHLNSPENTY